MARSKSRQFVLVLFIVASCSSPPAPPNIPAPVLTPSAGEKVVVDQLILLMDSSSSISERSLYRSQIALLESMVRSSPEGAHETAITNFGGYRRESLPLDTYSRAELLAKTASLTVLGEGSPIHKALLEAGLELSDRTGRASLVLFSDGIPTDEIGRAVAPEVVLEAAADISDTYDGQLCVHTVHAGFDPGGAELLAALSSATGCGSSRSAHQIFSVAALHQFQRNVFLGSTPPGVAAAPRDRDRDGVIDARDRCPGSPVDALVDSQGCWIVRNVFFALDSANIDHAGFETLDELAQVLRSNRGSRVRLQGHTDSMGDPEYNRTLSERRALATRDYLLAKGVSAEQLDAVGFGEDRPVAPNDEAGRRGLNRRVEISVVRPGSRPQDCTEQSQLMEALPVGGWERWIPLELAESRRLVADLVRTPVVSISEPNADSRNSPGDSPRPDFPVPIRAIQTDRIETSWYAHRSEEGSQFRTRLIVDFRVRPDCTTDVTARAEVEKRTRLGWRAHLNDGVGDSAGWLIRRLDEAISELR